MLFSSQMCHSRGVGQHMSDSLLLSKILGLPAHSNEYDNTPGSNQQAAKLDH